MKNILLGLLAALVVNIILSVFLGWMVFFIGYSLIVSIALGVLVFRYANDVEEYDRTINGHIRASEKIVGVLEKWVLANTYHEEVKKVKDFIGSYIQTLHNYIDNIKE